MDKKELVLNAVKTVANFSGKEIPQISFQESFNYATTINFSDRKVIVVIGKKELSPEYALEIALGIIQRKGFASSPAFFGEQKMPTKIQKVICSKKSGRKAAKKASKLDEVIILK